MTLREKLKKKADKKKAAILQKYFKTEKGEYGEGDIFLGVSVPEIRKIAKEHHQFRKSLRSKIHEERFAALLIMVRKFPDQPTEIFNFYLKNTKYINNWDLIDCSADKIIGAYLFKKPKDSLYRLAFSHNLWEKRIAMIACFYFIRKNEFLDAFKIVKILLSDDHHLIQKAVGWMLREIGKRNLEAEKDFLKENIKQMTGLTISYATEKFSREDKLLVFCLKNDKII